MILADDFETCETGTQKRLNHKDLVIRQLREALADIMHMESCLIADARERARRALEEHYD